jgi:outer membrane protein OmpA-like peptidoglycan-associated protein
MLNFRSASEWEFDTSSSAGAGLGPISVGVGSLQFIPPNGGLAIYSYRSLNAGISLGAALPDDMSVSFADKRLPSKGRIWMTPGFNGTELAANDLTGFCTIQEVSSALGSGQVMFLGISGSDLFPEAARDLFSLSVVGTIGDLILEKEDLDWPDIMKSKANAGLMLGGFGIGTNLFGVTGGLGYVNLAGMKPARIVNEPAPPRDYYPVIRYTEKGRESVVEISGDILFDFDKDVLKPSAQQTLVKVAERMKTLKPLFVNVWGFADSVGNDKYNMGLSYRRATRVRDWIVSKAGIAGGQVLATPFGANNPAAPNSTQAGRDRNRRVEIRMYK